MKNEENKPEMNTWIDPELEARVVAWVAGEASPFEMAELERILAEKPELAIFKRRIEAVHGLLGEAARPDAAPLRMSAERRAKLLAALGAVEKPEPAEQREIPAVIPFGAERQKLLGRQWWRVGAAACAAGVALLFVLRESGFASYQKVASNRRADSSAIVAFELPAMAQETKAKAVDDLTGTPASNFSPAPAARAEQPKVADVALVTPDAPRINFSVPPIAPAPAAPALGGGGAGGRGAPDIGGARGRMAENRFTRASSEAKSDVAPASSPVEAELAKRSNLRETFADAEKQLALNDTASIQGQPRDLSSFRGLDAAGTQAAGGYRYGGLLSAPGGTVLGAESTVATDANFARDANAVLSRALAGKPAVLLGAGGAGGTQGGQSNQEVKLDAFVVSGQKNASVTPAPTDAVVRLDPFTVKGDADGFVAASSLAGGRLATALKDTPVAYSQLTKEFLAGFGVTGPSPVGGTVPNALPAPAFEPPPGLVATDTLADAPGTTGNANARMLESADKKSEAAKRPASSATPLPSSNEETPTAREPVSTFSLHVSDVSFRLAQAALAAAARGETPREFEVRPEEFYNAFDYGDPSPATAEKVGARIEQSAHPFLQQRNLVRIALKVAATGRAAAQPLRLTVLLDTSGSMEREDRQAAVRRALQELVALLGENDRLTLIGFARTPRLLGENVRGNQAGWMLDLAQRTPAEGGTNLEEALKLGAELARRHQETGAQNRIVVLTDGAANLGNADPAQLTKMVEDLRQQGIAFDACGVGLEGVGDAVLEALTRKGDGRYYVLDSVEAADAGFARRLAGAFRPAAENVKVQVRFNPARVARYRLIGFEQHRLNEADFRNDQVDAAELAAEEAAVALYHVEALPQGEGELGEVSVRFRDPATGGMVERTWTMSYEARAPSFDRAPPSLQLAGVAAMMAEKLGHRPLAGQFKLGDFAGVMNGLRSHYANQPRVQELVTMFATARRLSGE